MAAPIVQAYSESLSQVFLWAAPVAAVGFVLALFLREVPLRDIHNSAVDIGDGFGMPSTDTPESLLENAIARMLRGDPGSDCAASRCGPIADSTWPGCGASCGSTASANSSVPLG